MSEFRAEKRGCTALVLLGGVLLGFAIAAATGGSGQPSSGNPQLAGPNQLELKPNAADVTTTQLPDTNYESQELLARRKRGFALMSADLADSKTTGMIDQLAVDPYTRDDYPDVVRRWGKLVPTINRERKIAAEIASRDARCDGVVNAQITDGGTRGDRHYMTECNNLTRIHFDAKSLAENRAAVVRTQSDMGAQGMLDW